MMMDIFSAFDPFNYSTFSKAPLLFWFLAFLPLVLISSAYWLSPPLNLWLPQSVINTAYDQIKRTYGINIASLALILCPLFLMIILINFIGMLPYTLSSSSHLLFSVTLALPLWLALIISSIMTNPKATAANLLPSGAPAWLSPPLILIETISIIVRPITLSVRLAANMSAGHVVLGLMGVYAASALMSNSFTAATLILVQMGYTLFEFGICLIQAYIFFLLLTLYSDEHSLTKTQ